MIRKVNLLNLLDQSTFTKAQTCLKAERLRGKESGHTTTREMTTWDFTTHRFSPREVTCGLVYISGPYGDTSKETNPNNLVVVKFRIRLGGSFGHGDVCYI